MVRIERASSGRPSMDIGMPPRPMALTGTEPILVVRMTLQGLVQGVQRGQARARLAGGPEMQVAVRGMPGGATGEPVPGDVARIGTSHRRARAAPLVMPVTEQG